MPARKSLHLVKECRAGLKKILPFNDSERALPDWDETFETASLEWLDWIRNDSSFNDYAGYEDPAIVGGTICTWGIPAGVASSCPPFRCGHRQRNRKG